MKSSENKKRIGCFGVFLRILVILILFLGGTIFFASAKLRRSDKDILKNYQPRSDISDIPDKTGLSEKGKATLYRGDPELVDGETFRKYCRISENDLSLGCKTITPGGGPFSPSKIFLLKIDDPRFADHKFAAAVHEMFHLAYSRLGSTEKERVNSLVEQEFLRLQNNAELATITEALKERGKTERSDLREEFHSKFAVEYESLSPELEEYYRQYFDDRQKVVAIYQSGGMETRIRKIDELKYELRGLNEKLTAMRNQLSAYQGGGEIEQYNSLVGQFNNMVSQYNVKVAEVNRLVQEIQKFFKYFNPGFTPIK